MSALHLSSCGFPAELEGFHVGVDGVRWHAVGDGFLDGVEGDDAREAHEGAEGNDVGEKWLADFLDGDLRDGDAHDVREVRDIRHELLVEDQQSIGIEVFVILVGCLLRHGQHEVRHDDVRMVDGRIVDDDLGFRGAAARLRTVRLRLDSSLPSSTAAAARMMAAVMTPWPPEPDNLSCFLIYEHPLHVR